MKRQLGPLLIVAALCSSGLEGVEIIRDLKRAKGVTFPLAFVTTQEQIHALAPAIAKKAAGDAIV